jgi:hypothetical protein
MTIDNMCTSNPNGCGVFSLVTHGGTLDERVFGTYEFKNTLLLLLLQVQHVNRFGYYVVHPLVAFEKCAGVSMIGKPCHYMEDKGPFAMNIELYKIARNSAIDWA